MSVGYGSEVWCTDKLVTSRRVRGPMVVIQALYRRLITPRGTLRGGDEESAYGFDLAEYVGAVSTELALAALPGIVRGELSKDDRVTSIDVTVTTSTDAAGDVTILLEVTGVLVDEEDDFVFTVAASATSVTLLGGITV